MDLFLPFTVIFLCSITTTTMAISSIHHDKPEQSSIKTMATNMLTENLTLTPAEREKRLLPYETFYQTQPFNLPYHHYHPPPSPNYRFPPPGKFTPFLESNALPGAFTPVLDHKVRFLPRPRSKVAPDFGDIYENLAQLKLRQNRDRPRYVLRPQADYAYRAIQPTRTTFETFTATSIDIPSGGEQLRPYGGELPQLGRKPGGFVIVAAPEARKPVIVVQRKPVLDAYEAPKYFRITEEPATGYTPELDHKPENYQQIPIPTSDSSRVPLGEILKHLQATNTLPKTLTPDNIDRSIKTLVKILDALKKRRGQGVEKDVVSAQAPPPSAIQSSDYEDEADNEAGVGISGFPGEQSYPPLDTEEGGTPGKPGVDYPALATIPPTTFSCKTQRYKGFFGDPDTHCQVWHYCDLNGGQASFLCPNGTIFSQVALTCDWWFNVKCATTAQLYVLNERLYKYIIPLSPKFPEDYSGPLVDKYLALKFQEMEEKMRKEKKGKGNPVRTEETMESEVVSSDSPTASSQKETLQTIEDHISNK